MPLGNRPPPPVLCIRARRTPLEPAVKLKVFLRDRRSVVPPTKDEQLCTLYAVPDGAEKGGTRGPGPHVTSGSHSDRIKYDESLLWQQRDN